MQWLVAAIGALLLFSSLAPTPAPVPGGDGSASLVGPSIAQAIAANRSTAEAPASETLLDLLYPYSRFADEEIIDRIAYVDERPLQRVSLQDAEDDVRFLFEMYKYGYALYQAFGGDEAFPQARDRILGALPALARPNGWVPVSALRSLLLENLAFVQDGHANFAGTPLYTHYDWFYNARYVFRKGDLGYCTTTHSTRLLGLMPVYWEGSKRYFVSVDGGAPEDSLVLSLTAEGELVCILSRVEASASKRLSTHLVLQSGESEQEVVVLLSRKGALRSDSGPEPLRHRDILDRDVVEC
jgi:hypothetical protein